VRDIKASDVGWKIAYLEKIKEIREVNPDRDGFIKAVSEASPH
jgi:hypothetical protein